MSNIYGYARVSTKTQRLDRQIDNINKAYPEVKQIYCEKWTGTEVDSRTEFQKLIKRVKTGDTIVFDSVSRMSRNAEEGCEMYEALYLQGVSLVFLKEPHINTDTYKKAVKNQVSLTGGMVDVILNGINEYLLLLAKEQIKIAFQQAEKEVNDLHQRVSEGMKATQKKNKELPEEQRIQIGQRTGAKLTTKKSIEMKDKIIKMSKAFDGNMNDKEVMETLGLARNTYYKYKRELQEESIL